MFGAVGVGKGLSFVKVISGISKTLSIANQVIPLYQQAKPMIGNAKSAFKILKEFSGSSKTDSDVKPVLKSTKTIEKKTNVSSSVPSLSKNNHPVFFV